jgi:hypothetical protein
MAEENEHHHQEPRHHVTENYKPKTPPEKPVRHNVDGNYVPTTGSGEPKSPPPNPKKK